VHLFLLACPIPLDFECCEFDKVTPFRSCGPLLFAVFCPIPTMPYLTLLYYSLFSLLCPALRFLDLLAPSFIIDFRALPLTKLLGVGRASNEPGWPLSEARFFIPVGLLFE